MNGNQLSDHIKKLEDYCNENKLPFIFIIEKSNQFTYSFNKTSTMSNIFYLIEHILKNGDLGFITIKTQNQQYLEEYQNNIRLLLDNILIQLKDHDRLNNCEISFSNLRANLNNFLKELSLQNEE